MAVPWKHLETLGELAADSLLELEARTSNFDPVVFRASFAACWRRMLDDSQQAGPGNLSSEYLASLHRDLASSLGGLGPGEFSDISQTRLVDGSPESWSRFLTAPFVNGVGVPEPAWVFAELYWGQHVRSFGLSLAWLAMNIALLEVEELAVYLPREDPECMMDFLRDSGPEDYDAEGLRGYIAGLVEIQRTEQCGR
jgi:hypothetical protein